MDRGLYIAASGMLSEQVRQGQISNDLANASTPGYKSDRSTQRSFGAMMLSNTNTGQQVGSLGMGVQIGRTVTDFTAAPLRQTDQPLDMAVEGDGFFAVRTNQGTRYTRDGQFSVSPQGTLVTANGNEVLSQGGAAIKVKDGKVDASQVGVFKLDNPRKMGDSLIAGAVAGRASGGVKTGFLEGSGVEPTRTIVDMMASFRAFESGQRVIRTIDESLGKAATVGQI